MYIQAVSLPKETQDDDMLDLVLRWVADLFARLGHFIAEEYTKASEWFIPVGHAAIELLRQHPHAALFIALLIFIGPWILLLPLFLLQAFFFVVLYVLGFGLSGIVGGSPAALYQSFCYGGHTPSSSIFAMLQSTGTYYNVGTASNWLLLAIRIMAGVLGLYVLIAIIAA